MKRVIVCIICACVSFYLEGCSGFDRDNPLDPKNSKSQREKVTLVEAFVNDGTPFSPFSISAIDVLESQIETEAVFLEYHVPSQNYADDYAIPSAKTRYDFYETQNRAVPDVFFNGLSHRVQGAASQSTVLTRFQAAYTIEKDVISYVTIEAQKQIENNTVSIDVKVARLGNERLANFIVQTVAFEDISSSGHHHVVRHIWEAESISTLEDGDKTNIEFSSALANGTNIQNWQFAVFVQETATKKVLQTVLVD